MRAFRVRVPAALEEDAGAALWEAGTQGVEVQPDAGGRVGLLAYFAERPGLEDDVRAALAALGVAALESAEVPEVDWVGRYREGFRAFAAGRFSIVPAWESPGGPASPDVLLVDPGRAFGTGTHETTRLCLAALAQLAGERPLGRVLDVGAGSGILGIAAARLGARSVVAVDSDPQAIASARVHADLNRVSLLLLVADAGRALRPASCDVIVANISAPLLIERREELAALRAERGRLVLSGLLDSDLPAVADAYARFGDISATTMGEWAAVRLDPPRA